MYAVGDPNDNVVHTIVVNKTPHVADVIDLTSCRWTEGTQRQKREGPVWLEQCGILARKDIRAPQNQSMTLAITWSASFDPEIRTPAHTGLRVRKILERNTDSEVGAIVDPNAGACRSARLI
jgi:hypothetical protein